MRRTARKPTAAHRLRAARLPCQAPRRTVSSSWRISATSSNSRLKAPDEYHRSSFWFTGGLFGGISLNCHGRYCDRDGFCGVGNRPDRLRPGGTAPPRVLGQRRARDRRYPDLCRKERFVAESVRCARVANVLSCEERRSL